jgi:DNA polymerase III sliding clamp (beta) subunit (PCNA family)
VKGVKIKLPEALKESLQRTKILSKEELETGNKMINITIENNLLTCHGECAIGEIDETIKIDYKEDKVVFTIVPDFLFEILDKTQTMVVGKKTLQFKTKNFLHNIQLIK